MMEVILYPEPKKFFIANTDGVYAFGEVNPDQCMETGLINIEVFEGEAIYIARLQELNLTQIVEPNTLEAES